jgi:phenylpropionate dioxygenase-like ring-hydroxylating dioxygenase large terminal subunit
MPNLDALNASTQPPQRFRVFNRGDVLPRAWYYACRGDELGRGSVRGVTIGAQRVVLFRGADGAVGCLDAFCPHMGTDLSIGAVVGDTVRCHFHHWRFARDGACAEIPCLSTRSGALAAERAAPGLAPGQAPPRTRAYAVTERYGALWIYPDAAPDHPLLDLPGLEGKETMVAFDKQNTANSPYHVSMVNGLDVQHLSTVHDVGLRMRAEVAEHDGLFDAVVEGPLPSEGLMGWLVRRFVAARGADRPGYAYAMRYAQASVAGLVLLQRTRWPELRMLFAYRPLPDGRSMTQPIFVAERRPGIAGWIRARVLLLATRIAYRLLEEEDERIYDHIRFTARNLLELDAPVARYIRYVEGLVPSDWSSPEAVAEHRARGARAEKAAPTGALPTGALPTGTPPTGAPPTGAPPTGAPPTGA